jgi:hypothetical protein
MTTKTGSLLAAFAAGLLLCASASATVLFQDSFQNDLSQWQPDNKIFDGEIVTAPDGGKALTLNGLGSGQDMMTKSRFTSATGSFTLSFDFMTTTGYTIQSGAFIYADGGTPNSSGWLLADSSFHGIAQFTDSGSWEHVSYTFTGSNTDLMIEDWVSALHSKVDSLYFRNMVLTDNAEGVKVGTVTIGKVPEPGSALLVGLGLAGMLGLRRKSGRA